MPTRSLTARLCVALLLLSMLLASACAGPAAASPQAAPTMPDRVREDVIRGDFQVQGSVAADKPFDLVFKIRPLVDMPGTSITLLVPEGVEVTAGSTTWEGDVAAKDTVEQRVTLVLPGDGEYDVRAVVKSPGGPQLNRVYHAFLDPKSPEGLKKEPKAKEYPRKLKLDVTPQKQSLVPEGDEAQTPGAQLAGSAGVTGRLLYQTDDSAVHPLRLHAVELWNSSATTLLDSTTTDESGYFSLNVPLSSSKSVFVVIWCETVASAVVDSEGYVYGLWTDLFTISPGYSYDLGTATRPYDEDLWEANDHVLTAYQWLSANTSGWTRSQVPILWPCGCWAMSSGDAIFLDLQTGPNYWDRTTVFHEYGHCAQYAAYGSFPTCEYSGSHYINTESCEEFALVEGFAEFFEAAVDDDPNNVRDYTCDAWEDIETNNWELGQDCTDNNSGAIVEGAVASILWDMFDSHNYPAELGDRDSLSLGFDEIWYAMLTYTPQTINELWTAWFDIGYGLKPEMNLVYYDHGVDKDTEPLAPDTPLPADGSTCCAPSSLSWVASDPDGDALLYDVYLGTTATPPLEASDLTEPTYPFATPLAEDTYYWYVVAKDAIGKEKESPLWQFVVSSGETSLSQGWNLISLPRVPADPDPAAVFASIDSSYDAVYAYTATDTADPWKQYIPGAPAGNDLTALDPTMGVWIHTTGPVEFCLAGSTSFTSTISLKTGWNLVGYPSQTSHSVADALASIADKYEVVYAFSTADTADPWKKYDKAMPAALDDLTQMVPGKGYWIRVTEDCTWTLP